MTPTARTLKLLRAEGYLASVVERWIPHANRRADLWGAFDVLAVQPRDRVFLLVQVTSAAHVADRLRKVQARPETALWLRAGGKVEVHGWRGKCLRRLSVSAEGLQPVLMEKPRRRRPDRQRGLFDPIDRPALASSEAPGSHRAAPPIAPTPATHPDGRPAPSTP